MEKLTASFGVAAVDKNDNKLSIVQKADKALYKAKTVVKNKICVYGVCLKMVSRGRLELPTSGL